MKKIKFTKMVAAGNDFIVTELRAKSPELKTLARQVCDRKFGVGADGLLVLTKSVKADIRMRIFNADGSEAEMCGNGARCAGLFAALKYKKQNLVIETAAGLIQAVVRKEDVKVQLTEPKNLNLDLPVRLVGPLRVNFINTGVPHAVVFVDSVDKIDVFSLGRQLRFHKIFAPQGTNVDFVEIVSQDKIKVRTYERGVEDETLACGTGVTASALVTAIKLNKVCRGQISVLTRSGETLKVYFNVSAHKFSNVWLEGKAGIICEGEYHV